MKDKIIQIAGVELHTIVLTQEGKLFDYNNAVGEWKEIEIPAGMLELEDVPRFTFGKYNGQPIVDAPSDYIEWCREKREGFNWLKVDGKLVEDKLEDF